MSDDEIVENLKEHTLQTFSQYCPLKKWIYIGPEHAVNTTGTPGQPQYVFKIPKPDDEPIVDILEVLFGPYSVEVNALLKQSKPKKLAEIFVYSQISHRNIDYVALKNMQESLPF